MKTILILTVLCLANCAETVIWEGGHKVAQFQGDVKNLNYQRTPWGSVTLTAESIDHSSATKAQGEAMAGKINAAGAAVAASGVTMLVK